MATEKTSKKTAVKKASARKVADVKATAEKAVAEKAVAGKVAANNFVQRATIPYEGWANCLEPSKVETEI
jgi:hypothetical protein